MRIGVERLVAGQPRPLMASNDTDPPAWKAEDKAREMLARYTALPPADQRQPGVRYMIARLEKVIHLLEHSEAVPVRASGQPAAAAAAATSASASVGAWARPA